MSIGNRWLQLLAKNPGHSAWYIKRFRQLEAEGNDIFGEARFVDAMVERGSRILDAGCGSGRIGGRLAQLGHKVVGVDLDPELLMAADADYPGPKWIHADLSELNLPAVGVSEHFDAIVCAGNVMNFIDPATRVSVLQRLSAHLAPSGRMAVGFGAGQEYPFAEFESDVESAGLRVDIRFSTWHLHPFHTESDFLVAVLSQ